MLLSHYTLRNFLGHGSTIYSSLSESKSINCIVRKDLIFSDSKYKCCLHSSIVGCLGVFCCFFFCFVRNNMCNTFHKFLLD